MKKCRSIQVTLAATVFAFAQSNAQSEWTSPDQWENLIRGKANPYVSDTIIMQDFEDNISQWPYSVEGKYDYCFPKELGIKNASEGKAICLYPGSIFTIASYTYDAYEKIGLKVPYAIQHINKGEEICFTVHKKESDNNVENEIPWPIPQDDYSCGFGEKKTVKGKSYESVFSTSKTPSDLIIEITENRNPSGGYYCIDQIYLYGNARTYSLFSGPGKWRERSLWSNNIPTRNRNALINSDVIIDFPAICKEMITCDANIQLLEGGSLEASKVTVILPFPEKGKWYFVSFPFDVYPENIDSRFRLGDQFTQITSKTANVIYVQEYDGVKRSEQNQAANNWSVIPSEIEDKPLFRRGKGYLVALDDAAKIDSLCFISPPDTKLSFESEAEIVVDADLSQQGDDEHNGWFLCGNPYPSSLSLQDIEANPDLDGSIYYYEEGEYKTYPIGSDHVLPPFAAFFVKAKRSTEIRFRKKQVISSFRSTLQLYSGENSEPSVTGTEVVCPRTIYRIQDRQIYLQNLWQQGSLSFFDMNGRLIRKTLLNQGDSYYALPEQKGVYLVVIQVGEYTESFLLR